MLLCLLLNLGIIIDIMVPNENVISFSNHKLIEPIYGGKYVSMFLQ